MAIDQGNYVMVNCDHGLALDVAGASGTKGENIRLFTKNDGDAQIISVVNVSGSLTDQILRFPSTWQCLDASKGAVHGSNVIQWPYTESRYQKWNIVADGNRTYAIDGVSYQVYIVQLTADTDFVLGSNVNPGQTKSTTNVCIDDGRTDGGGYKADRRWVFIPMNGLTDGVYRFMPSNAQNVSVGVTGKAGDVQIGMHANSDTNYQRWTVKKTSATSGQTYISSRGDGWKATAVSTADGADIRLGDDSHGNRQKWVVVPAGTGTFNGQDYPLVKILCVAGEDRVWDAQGGVPTTKVNTKLISHSENGGANQKWLAVAESWLDPTLPAPSDLGCAYSSGGKKVGNLWSRGKQNYFPTFKSTGKQFQMRYRTRTRKATAGDEVFSSWSPWKSISNDSATGDGWGIETTPNCAVTAIDGRFYSKSVPLTLSTTGNDLIEFQFQVREWRKYSASDIAHGNAATHTGRLKWKPTLTVSSITWSPDGYSVQYSSDQKRGNNDFNLYKVVVIDAVTGVAKTVFDGDHLINDIDWSGSMLFPASKVNYIPNEGDMVSITGRWTNVDGAYNQAQATYTGIVSYGSGYDPGLFSSTATVDPMKMLDVDCDLAGGSLYDLYLDYNDDGTNLHKYSSTDGTWYIPPSFGKPFSIQIVARSGDSWDIEKKTFDAVENPDSYWFNFQKGNGTWGCFQLAFDEGKPPTIIRKRESDYDAQLTNGEYREVVHFGYGRKERGSVRGLYVPRAGRPYTSTSLLWGLEDAHYAYLRPSNSEVYRVAITDFQTEEADWYHTSITINYVTTDSISTS